MPTSRHTTGKFTRLSAKEIVGNRKNLVKWQDEFWQHMVKQYPELELSLIHI